MHPVLPECCWTTRSVLAWPPRRDAGQSAAAANGFISCRSSLAGSWSSPAGIVIQGGGTFWPVVGTSIDVILLATNTATASHFGGREGCWGCLAWIRYRGQCGRIRARRGTTMWQCCHTNSGTDSRKQGSQASTSLDPSSAKTRPRMPPFMGKSLATWLS